LLLMKNNTKTLPMKKIAIILFAVTLFVSCKQEKKIEVTEEIEVQEIKKEYPANISKVFKAHGGIDAWNKMQSLTFGMDRPNGAEVITTNLKSRASLIDAPNYMLGHDGTDLWVKSKDTSAYKGNAKFYNGLMSYFYAMPFIVGDDGIIYKEAKPLEFEGTTYPGVLISYNAGVGVSPNDEYIVYYNPETYQMEWLAYTVTFGKDGKSDKFSYIKYNNWTDLGGLQLPKSIDWYTVEEGQPVAKRNTVEFTQLAISSDAPDASLFAAPEGATMVK